MAKRIGVIDGTLSSEVLLPAVPHSLGLETPSGGFIPFIERGSTVPTRMSRVVTTPEDTQSALHFHVAEQESAPYQGRFHFKTNATRTVSLGEFNLRLRETTQQTAQVEVTFELDSRGVLTVTATSLETGQSQSLVVRGSRPFTDRDRPAHDTEFAELQRPFRELIQLRTHVHEAFMELASSLTRLEVRKVVGAIQQANEIEEEKREADVGAAVRLLQEATAILRGHPLA